MARSDDDGLPADLTGVAAEIGRFLPETGPPVGIAEVLPVWVITLADLQSKAGLAKAEDQDLWQLQLSPEPGARAVAFARVKDLAGAAEVQAVYRSPLAGQIDDALDLADRLHPGNAWRARILDVPDAHLTLLWLTRPGANRVIFLDDAVPGEARWHKSEDLSGRGFRNRLQGLQPIRGIEPVAGGDEEDVEAERYDS